MKKNLLKSALLAGATMLLLPGAAAATGIVGQCADCHTMHNSEQGAAVAMVGLSGDITATPIQNLLRMDCIACHAGGTEAVVTLDGGSQVPQVYHTGPNDLAAGNFRYIDDIGGNRKGHNPFDLFGAADAEIIANEFVQPPGMYHQGGGHANRAFGGQDYALEKFSCAGSGGCHGTRGQLLEYAGTVEDPPGSGIMVPVGEFGTRHITRRGIAAVSGAHHNSKDGAKTPAPMAAEGGHAHDGQYLADSYRFIAGLIGTGSSDRWRNVDATIHNEYYGVAGLTSDTFANQCQACHVYPSAEGYEELAHSPNYMGYDTAVRVIGQSMSGFCITCHGNFHSSGGAFDGGSTGNTNPTQMGGVVTNGTSGAFLRHPSDFVIPNSGEYAAYTAYNITAPVARQTAMAGASAVVTPGADMVMCLSCHQAHATEFDGMLRFDYQAMIAGGTTVGEVGCIACHTTKGTLPQ